MKTGKRLTALLLALALLMTLAAPGWATTAHAASIDVDELSMTYINPLYEDVITEADLKKPGRPVLYGDNRDNEYYYAPDAAGDLIRDDLVARDETIIVDVFVPYTGDAQADFENACYETLAWGMIHTGVPTEGDYLQWQYAGWGAQAMDYGLSDGMLCLTINFTITYYTTADQEAAVDVAVAELLADLDVYDADDYTKLKAVYDYICANVTYDHKNLNDDNYKLKHTAYAAIIDGTAVCQGYALLLYRLALELGVDARLIAGDGGGPHGWNIAAVDGLYYNLDSTWDAGQSVYSYFLVSPDNFTDHVRYPDYDTAEFHEVYPMAATNYVANCNHQYVSEIISLPTCTEDGVETFTCTICGHFYNNVTPADGHNYETVTVEATCVEEGYMAFTCTACGDSYRENVVPALGHNFDEGVVTKAPTCIETGITTYTCKACGQTQQESMDLVDHTYDEGTVTVAPTCTAVGEMTYTCTVCADTTTTDIEMLPHSYADGFCATCGIIQMTAPTIKSCYSTKQDSVKVTWTVSEGADGYELYRTTDPVNGEWTLAKTIKSGTEDRYTNQGLEIGTTYYYKVRAYTEDANGAKTYTAFSAVDYMPAAVVFNGPYSNSTARIRILWNEVSGAHGYQIWRQNDDGSWGIVKTLGDKGNELTDDQGGTTAYSNTGLESGKTYTYKMRAFTITEDGRKVFGAYSDEISVAVMPEAPVVTGTSPKATRAQIAWEAVNGAAGYQIWMAEGNGEYKIVKSVTDGSTTYTKYDLTSGKTYSFKIRAYTEVAGKKTFGSYSNLLDITVQ